ncbi:MAG: cell division protein FtsI (penicillin-binding protein 3) [Microgenomates group bacterium Gr01-1014_16]|nr:MAG: cell division protein FtsI (penicillin-binding protein 3) [Microgenomates group bacterium Gr01-1014_16]
MSRIRLLKFVFWLGGLGIACRLIYWQVFQASSLKAQADQQQLTWFDIPSPRGDILASDLFPLATSVENYLLYIDPQKLSSTDFLASLPSSDSAKARLQTALDSSLSWYVLSHQVPQSVKEEIESRHISGLGFEPEPGRTYPEGTASAYLLGFVAQNQSGLPQGYFGLEGFYDRLLSGRPGRLLQEHDAFNRPIIFGKNFRILPQSGHSIKTSIDRTVQHIIYQALSDGLAKYNARGGSIAVLEPFTGQVLGLVSIPGYDPAAFSKYSQSDYPNPLVADSYEPGSTFKAIVMAAALDSGVVTPQTICATCSGPVTIGDATVRSYNDKYYPGSDMFDVILHSDNVGMVFVSRKLGRSQLLDYIRRFGFGSPTGIDLQEESSPPLRPDDQWREIDWATLGFGQGIAITRLQLLRAVSVIANGGKLVSPRIGSGQLINGRIEPFSPTPPTRIISAKSAALVTQMMVNGVNRGEVRYYKPPGFQIAGKTGTAQVPISGHYDPTKVISSFIGFAPADNPKFVMLVTLDDPTPSQWGSTTAAPIWFSIARQLFAYYGIPPTN